MQTALERLHKLFTNAPTLGSLINPADVPLAERMFSADYEEVAPLLQKALARERDDPAAAVLGAAAEGVAKAAKLLAGQYTLVATNVPYLGLRLQVAMLQDFVIRHHGGAKHNLGTAFVERCLSFCTGAGSVALVTPQNWLFQSNYEELRRALLSDRSWDLVARLGTGAFETISGAVVNVALCIITNSRPFASQCHFSGIDASEANKPLGKSELLCHGSVRLLNQTIQTLNPEARITLEQMHQSDLLEKYVIAQQGIKTGDDDRWRRCFWELAGLGHDWRFYQSTVSSTQPHGGREQIIDWSHQGLGMVCPRLNNQAVGKLGVAVKQIGELPATLYTGELYDSNVAPLVPRNKTHLPALWAFCSSPEYNRLVRQIDKGWKVSNGPLTKVPFDLEFWQAVADAAGPLPEPYSNDPTQWLFPGHPVDTTEPLQVAVARLLGYRWPQQADDNLAAFADADGIVCLPAVAGEAPAAERLRSLLAVAYGDAWSAAAQERLLASVGFTGKTLEDWLVDGFFSQHCRLFHNRPFIWHVWDGRKDGFAALVNYHKLDRARLEKLTYTYLGAWIGRQRDEQGAGIGGADGRLVEALKLQKKLVAILDGEPPYDIYVRWKPLAEQPIGWAPDLNDGVRLNIRPFVTAGVLRSKFTINWKVDRGTNPDGSARINDRHLTRAEKLAARQSH